MRQLMLGLIMAGVIMGNVWAEPKYVFETTELQGVVKITKTETPDTIITVDNKRLETLERELSTLEENKADILSNYVVNAEKAVEAIDAKIVLKNLEIQGAADAGVTKLVVE